MRAAAPRVVAADKRGDCFPDGAERCEGHSLILSGWAVVSSWAHDMRRGACTDLLKVAEGDQRPVLPQRILDFGGHGLPICYVGYVQHRPRRKYVLQPVQQQSKSNIKAGARGAYIPWHASSQRRTDGAETQCNRT